MLEPDFTVEELEALCRADKDHFGVSSEIATFALRMMRERDDAKEIATAYSSMTRGGKAWLISDFDLTELKRGLTTERTARRAAIDALQALLDAGLLRCSGDVLSTDLLYRSPAHQLRKQADEMEARDEARISARTVLKAYAKENPHAQP